MSWKFAPASLRLPLAVLSLEFLLFALARLRMHKRDCVENLLRLGQ